MPFTFRELDSEVRGLMGAEIKDAIATGSLYFSKRFNDAGRAAWSDLLLEAATSRDEHWLAYRLETIGAMEGWETRTKPGGGYTTAHVPDTAAETLADGEFNRYYMCAVCRKAIAAGGPAVTVYRAKERANPRAGSEALIGTTFDPAELVVELRQQPSGAPHPLLQPNSGLSVHS